MYAEFPSSANTEDIRFRALFGTSPSVCAVLWDRCVEVDKPGVSEGAVPCHLLWALALLKQYSGDDLLLALMGGVYPKTFRKWSWMFVDVISFLQGDVVSAHCATIDQLESAKTDWLLIFYCYFLFIVFASIDCLEEQAQVCRTRVGDLRVS